MRKCLGEGGFQVLKEIDIIVNQQYQNKGWIRKKLGFTSVQAWLDESFTNFTIEDLEEGVIIPKLSEMVPLRPILWKLAHKVELATQLKARTSLSSTPMQVSLNTF